MTSLVLLGMAVTSLFLVVMVACCLASRETRRTVVALVLLGLLFSCIKILIVQQAPQWQGIVPDENYYDSNARAFVSHWAGEVVDAQTHQLRGLLASHAAGLHGAEWMPDEKLPYSLIVGSHEWLYAGYVALWYWLGNVTLLTVVWTNALWAAFLPAAAFGIAYSLGARKDISLVAAGFTLLDPSIGVNASWLLKDTLASFLSMATLWAFLAYIKIEGKLRLLIAVFMLSALGCVRFVAFIGLLISTGVICGWLAFQKKELKHSLLLVGALLCAWLMQGLLAQLPYVHLGWGSADVSVVQLLSRPVRVFSNGVGVLHATTGSAVDDSVLTWKMTLADDPWYALLRSMAHTLFAPYPWVAISQGLTWKSPIELYYPGVLVWIFALPGIFIAIVQGLRRIDPVYWLLLLFLGSQLVAYTIWLGEWSTRQRVFALPAFFALAVIGWVHFGLWFSSLCRVGYKNQKN